MRFPTMWYVRPTKPQIRLRIRIILFGVSKLKKYTFVKMPHCWKSHVTAQLYFSVVYSERCDNVQDCQLVGCKNGSIVICKRSECTCSPIPKRKSYQDVKLFQ